VAAHWGNRVTERRKRLGFSQAQLAELVEREQQTISKIEAGLAVPRVDLMEAIAKALGTKPWLLFTWPEQAPNRRIAS
jgi:transcriptional regulator with XRE-family HTH domain